MIARLILPLCCLAIARLCLAQDAPADPLRPILKRYCFECHGEKKNESGIRLDTLPSEIDATRINRWRSVLKALARGTMPPEGQSQPDRNQKKHAILWLTKRLAQAEADQRNTQPLRRLDRDEYRNTIRDLLEMDVSLFDPTREFPLEISPTGREIVSLDSLTTHYLAAANAVIERAVHPEDQPREEKHVFRGRFAAERSLCAGLLERHDCESLLAGPGNPHASLTPKEYQGTQAAGHYRIRIRATAVTPPKYFPEIEGIEAGEPLRLAVEFPGPATTKPPRDYSDTSDGSAKKVFELRRDGKPHDYEWEVWLEKSMVPRMTFANGPKKRPSEVWVLNNLPDLWKYPDPQASDRTIWQHAMLKVLLNNYRGPMIHVHEFRVTGPVHKQWPPRSHRILIPADDPSQDAEEHLRRFAERAFRRPVTRNEIEPVLGLFRTQLAEGKSTLEALKSGFKAILCSPSFLFLVEPQEQLIDYAIASRLSYFLWSSMPDETLLALAEAGRLTDPKVRREQTRRMLDHPRSSAFIRRFPDRWLNLDRPDIAPPDQYTFPQFYEWNLDYWSRRETQSYFHHIVSNDLSIANFLDSDFTFANYELSKLYDLPRVSGRTLRKVRLNGSSRGGLLGHSSVLMATATGPETSPVLRGVWILKSLLGDPPDPPPPAVEPLEPDSRGARTIRERLNMHRSSTACSICHRKIDPLGFPLEVYDRIGRLRTTYPEHNRRIDTAGKTPRGDSFRNVSELKKLLLNHKEELARCLVENLLEYARGRPAESIESTGIDTIVKESRRSGFKMKQLLFLVVQSDLFTDN